MASCFAATPPPARLGPLLRDRGFIGAPIANRERRGFVGFADGDSRTAVAQRQTSRSKGLQPKSFLMRAEAEQLVETIKQSVGLLRRHL
jgi:hypothetical protein